MGLLDALVKKTGEAPIAATLQPQGDLWRCPTCDALLRKVPASASSWANRRPGDSVGGVVTCGGCRTELPFADVYGGRLDVPSNVDENQTPVQPGEAVLDDLVAQVLTAYRSSRPFQRRWWKPWTHRRARNQYMRSLEKLIVDGGLPGLHKLGSAMEAPSSKSAEGLQQHVELWFHFCAPASRNAALYQYFFRVADTWLVQASHGQKERYEWSWALDNVRGIIRVVLQACPDTAERSSLLRIDQLAQSAQERQRD